MKKQSSEQGHGKGIHFFKGKQTPERERETERKRETGKKTDHNFILAPCKEMP